MISHLDCQIGEILRALETRAGQHIVVFAGIMAASAQHGLMGKQSNYEQRPRAADRVRGGIPRNVRTDALPIFTSTHPLRSHRRALRHRGGAPRPAMRDPREKVRAPYFCIFRACNTASRRRHKLIEYVVRGEQHLLFDLQNDPIGRNLAGDPAYAASSPSCAPAGPYRDEWEIASKWEDLWSGYGA